MAQRNERMGWQQLSLHKAQYHVGNNPFGYRHHEEQYVTNPNDIILLNYNATVSNWKNVPDRAVVATYELNYGTGKVIALGIYSDDIISDGSFDRYFDSLLMKYASRHNADQINPISPRFTWVKS